ncbi:MAG: PTS sugar transporter subunit IIB [Elusimicrobiaceae bacterium]|nr:PTS sugar transporter subunit IIB [Elusimicrobiaceae bacterium]
MAVVFTRIDDRLIHGQVVEGWIPFLDANEVVVISAAAAQDEMSRTLMRLSLPDEIGLEIFEPAAGAKYLAQSGARPERILVLAPGPAEVVELIGDGFRPAAVNVGGMHYSVGKSQIGRAIFLDGRDIESLKAIAAAGIRLEGRGVPSDSETDIVAMLH